MLYPKKLGELIRLHRTKLQLSQGAVAKATEFDQSYISKVESGRETPSLDGLLRIAESIGLEQNPGILLDALAGKVGDDGALKAVSVLSVPVDFSVDEWRELRDTLDFIVWKRTRPLPLLATIADISGRTAEEVEELLEQIDQGQKYLAELQARFKQLGLRKTGTPNTTPPDKP